MAFVGSPRLGKPLALTVGEPFLAGAKDVPDPVERVILAAAVAVDVLLHAASDVVDDGGERREACREVVKAGAILEPLCPHRGGVEELRRRRPPRAHEPRSRKLWTSRTTSEGEKGFAM